ncbi:MAG: Lar family restriction alleviation protein [Rhizobiaceae bacterium]|nr:Lar family restriction alleviation protein [Rhizobiaceae bacterium]
MPDDVKLLPCAHCGCDDIGTEQTITDGSVWCRGCLIKMTKRNWPRDDRGQSDAIAAWNRRTLPSLPSDIDGLVEELEKRKDAAYEERNKVVAALTHLFPSGIKNTDIPGWSPDWHGCVYIDLPTGQVSWHFHDSQRHLFDGLAPYQGEWDGHDTEEKYRRLAALRARQAPEPFGDGYCTDCGNRTVMTDGRCSCGSGRVIADQQAPEGVMLDAIASSYPGDPDGTIRAEIGECILAEDAAVDAGHKGLSTARQLYVSKDDVRVILRAALSAMPSGYRFIPPGQLDRETIEKCAAVADNVSKSTLAQEAWDPDDDDYSCEAYEEAEYAASVASSIADAIRALGAEK